MADEKWLEIRLRETFGDFLLPPHLPNSKCLINAFSIGTITYMSAAKPPKPLSAGYFQCSPNPRLEWAGWLCILAHIPTYYPCLLHFKITRTYGLQSKGIIPSQCCFFQRIKRWTSQYRSSWNIYSRWEIRDGSLVSKDFNPVVSSLFFSFFFLQGGKISPELISAAANICCQSFSFCWGRLALS